MSDGIFRHTPVLAGALQSRVITCDSALFPHVGDVITKLTNDYEWLAIGDSVDDVTQAAWLAVSSFYGNDMIGKIDLFLRAIPDGWLALDGTTYDEADYPELYAVIDAIYKSVPAETFTLPDMSDLFIVGAGSTYDVGDTGGANTHALTVAELAAHSHSYVPPLVDIDLEAPGAPDVAAARLGTPTQTGTTGSGDGHENRPPYIAVTYAIFAGR